MTAVGLLVRSGLVRAGAGADHRTLAWPGLAWPGYLWDPWFLPQGLLAAAALLRAGRPQAAFPAVDPAR